MKIETIRPATRTEPPIEVKLQKALCEIKRLKRELKVERAHAREMLAIQRRAAVGALRYEVCTCAPARADFFVNFG